MKKKFLFFLSTIVIFSCHQQKRIISSATIVNDTVTSMNTQPDQYKKQLEQGVDFIASGTEPFWSLEIDFNKSMHFETVSNFDITTPAVAGVKAMNADVTRYAAETEKGSLIVQIMRAECTNSMSGNKSPYHVTVNARFDTNKALKRYEGCGQYLYDYRLNDIWVLESINNQKMNSNDFTKGLPQLEFNIAQQKIFGHTGCNNINGAIEVQGKKISIGYLAGTRIACPNMEFENKYLNSLSNKAISYNIKPGRLYLQVDADSIFTYRKTD